MTNSSSVSRLRLVLRTGSIVFGLSAALWGEITITSGRVDQSNFHDYRLMRLNETPRIVVHIVPSSEAPGGVGEPGGR